MNAYQRYIKLKALADYYESLSDDDKRLLTQSLSENENLLKKLNVIEEKVDRNKYSFLTDVGANVLGNALFDIPVWLISKLIKR